MLDSVKEVVRTQPKKLKWLREDYISEYNRFICRGELIRHDRKIEMPNNQFVSGQNAMQFQGQTAL